MEKTFNLFKKVGEAGIALAGVSFVFYFAGYLYQAAYFSALDISRIFVDFNYQHSVIKGVFSLFIFVGFVPILVEWFSLLSLIKKDEARLSVLSKEIGVLESQPNNTSEVKQKIIETRKGIKETTDDLKKFKGEILSQNLISITSWTNIIVLLVVVSITLVAGYYIGKLALLTLAIIELLVGIMFSLIIFDQIKKIVRKDGRHPLLLIQVAVIFSIILLPVLFGYMEGKVKLRDNYFSLVNVTTEKTTINSVAILGFGNDFFIFRKDGINFLIPKSEIKTIQSLKSQ